MTINACKLREQLAAPSQRTRKGKLKLSLNTWVHLRKLRHTSIKEKKKDPWQLGNTTSRLNTLALSFHPCEWKMKEGVEKTWLRVVASIHMSTRDNFRVFVPTQSFTHSLSTSTIESETPVCFAAEQHSAWVSFLLECWRQVGKWIYLICAMCESIITCPPSQSIFAHPYPTICGFMLACARCVVRPRVFVGVCVGAFPIPLTFSVTANADCYSSWFSGIKSKVADEGNIAEQQTSSETHRSPLD